MNMTDYPTVHLNSNKSKGTTCSRKGMDVNEHERLSNSTLEHKLK